MPGERGVHGHAGTSPYRRTDRRAAQCVRQTARAALFLVQLTDERRKATETHGADHRAGDGAVLERVARLARRRLIEAHRPFRCERPAPNLDGTRPLECGRSRFQVLCLFLRSHRAP